jgi:hypothetical protein
MAQNRVQSAASAASGGVELVRRALERDAEALRALMQRHNRRP